MTVLDPTPQRSPGGPVVSASTDAVVDALIDLPLAPPDATYNLPPDDTEMWSYTEGRGGLFLVFSAFSKMCLGIALGFLSVQGQWLLMLMPFATKSFGLAGTASCAVMASGASALALGVAALSRRTIRNGSLS